MACRLFSANAAILSIRPLGASFSEILFIIQQFSFKEMHLKISSAKVAAILPDLNVLNGGVVPHEG